MASQPTLQECLEALTALYGSYAAIMSDHYDFPGNSWTPYRGPDTEALQALALIKRLQEAVNG